MKNIALRNTPNIGLVKYSVGPLAMRIFDVRIKGSQIPNLQWGQACVSALIEMGIRNPDGG